MVKKLPFKLNLLRQRKRSAIQLYRMEHPNETSKKIAQIYNVSPMTVSKWINKSSFYYYQRKRSTKMTRNIRNFFSLKPKINLLVLIMPVIEN